MSDEKTVPPDITDEVRKQLIKELEEESAEWRAFFKRQAQAIKLSPGEGRKCSACDGVVMRKVTRVPRKGLHLKRGEKLHDWNSDKHYSGLHCDKCGLKYEF